MVLAPGPLSRFIHTAKVSRRFWMLIALVLALGAALLCRFEFREPRYNGQSLSYWLTQLSAGYRAPILAGETAIRAIGPRAAPFLFAKVRASNSAGRRLWGSFYYSP